MLAFLPPVLRGSIAFVLLLVNTLFWCTLLLALSLVKLVLPFAAVRRVIDPALNAIATAWIACNGGWMRLTQRTDNKTAPKITFFIRVLLWLPLHCHPFQRTRTSVG